MRVLIGFLVAALLLCAVGGCLFWRLTAWLGEEMREPVWSASCDGHSLVVEHVSHHNHLAGVTTERHFEGHFDDRAFALDGDADPTFYRWNPTRRRDHGDGADALHIFVGSVDLELADSAAIEHCIEAHADALLAALDDAPHDGFPDRVWRDRRRVYWSGTAEDLVPRFSDGERTLELQRRGSLTLIEPFGAGGTSESSLGSVVEEDGALRIEWEYGHLEDEELARFVDDAGQTLPTRLEQR